MLCALCNESAGNCSCAERKCPSEERCLGSRWSLQRATHKCVKQRDMRQAMNEAAMCQAQRHLAGLRGSFMPKRRQPFPASIGRTVEAHSDNQLNGSYAGKENASLRCSLPLPHPPTPPSTRISSHVHGTLRLGQSLRPEFLKCSTLWPRAHLGGPRAGARSGGIRVRASSGAEAGM